MGNKNTVRRWARAAAGIGACVLASAGAWAQTAPQAAPASQTAPSRLEDYQLMALSVGEGVAILRTPQRQLVTLRIGGTLPAAKARLVQVLGDRIRFETADEQGRRQTVWIVRGAGPDQPDQVQRVSSTAPSRPTTPSTSTLITVPLNASGPSK